MGFNGDVVVFRSSAELSELAPHVGAERHPVSSTWSYSGGWQAVHIRHFDEPYEFNEPWIAELMARTGAPVLVCNVFESDAAHVQGVSSAGTWEAWLDHGSAAVRLGAERWNAFMEEFIANDDNDDGEPLDPPYHMVEVFEREAAESLELGRAQCAQDAVRWAAAAGREIPVEPIMQLLAAKRDPFVQTLFFRLLIHLGIDDRPDPEVVRPRWKPAIDPEPLSTSLAQVLKGNAHIVCLRESQILLVRSADPADSDGIQWTLPGSEVHNDEDSCDAALRGAQESTGYLVEVDNLIGMDNRTEGLHIYYSAHTVSGELSDMAEWIDLDAVSGLARTPMVDAALARRRPSA